MGNIDRDFGTTLGVKEINNKKKDHFISIKDTIANSIALFSTSGLRP